MKCPEARRRREAERRIARRVALRDALQLVPVCVRWLALRWHGRKRGQ